MPEKPNEMPEASATTSDNDVLMGLQGRTIAGRYEIIKRIGRGGMGVVYLAQQSTLSRNVVIKVLAPNLVDDPNALARFEREARGLSRLQHPNVVTIFDFGRDGELAFIAMEYVQGETLSRFLKRTGPLPLRDFLAIAAQILKGIGEAHKLGLIHRDVKPANIMLCELEGEPNFVKILDFGLAKLVQSPVEVTKEQHLVGSAAFLAPEQILNGVSDPRSDVYALGVLFTIMLSGRRPFEAANDAILLYKHVNEEAPPLATLLPKESDVPPAIAALVDQCLAKNPDNRPQDANALLSAFAGLVTTPLGRAPWGSAEFTPVPAAPRPSLDTDDDDVEATTLRPRDPLPAATAKKSGATMLWLGLVLALLLSGAAVALWWFLVRAPAEAPSAPKVTASATADRHDTLAEILQQVAKEIQAERWGKAEILLDGIADDLKHSPELLAEAADYRDAIALGRLLGSAQRADEEGDIPTAIKGYEEVIARDAGHPLATERLRLLRESLAEQSSPGRLSLSGPTKATVAIDNVVRGELPLELDVPPGVHLLSVEAEGFVTWQREVEVGPGKTVSLDVVLVQTAVATETTSTKKRTTTSRGGTRDSAPQDSADKGSSSTRNPGDLLLPVGGKKSDKKPKSDLLLP